jgi:hypothetical protein
VLALSLLLACSRSTTTNSSAAAGAGAVQGAEAERQALAQIEDNWARALEAHDTVFFSRVLAADFHGTEDSAKTFGRSEVIRNAGDTTVQIRDLHDEDREIRIFGDGNVGVVTGLSKWTVQSGERTTQQSGRYTEVFVKRDGRWQAVAGHYSGVPATK